VAKGAAGVGTEIINVQAVQKVQIVQNVSEGAQHAAAPGKIFVPQHFMNRATDLICHSEERSDQESVFPFLIE
jgi:hypothetical protein